MNVAKCQYKCEACCLSSIHSVEATIRFAASLIAPLDRLSKSLVYDAMHLSQTESNPRDANSAILVSDVAGHLSKIVDQLNQVSGRQTLDMRMVQIVDFVPAITPLLERLSSPNKLTIVQELATAFALVDEFQLEQTLITLMRQVPEIRDGKQVKLRISRPQPDEFEGADRYISLGFELPENTQNNPSLPDLFLPELWASGDSYWIGLATIWGTITQMGGFISFPCCSEGRASIGLYLPVAE